jgi:hypothetical protein
MQLYENGRSGGIRTHDPQSPRLMRYQAALRSDTAPSSKPPPHWVGAHRSAQQHPDRFQLRQRM